MKTEKFYATPELVELQLNVEQGFAQSGTLSGPWGDPGYAGDDLGSEDAWEF